jgi:hypothetical protein
MSSVPDSKFVFEANKQDYQKFLHTIRDKVTRSVNCTELQEYYFSTWAVNPVTGQPVVPDSCRTKPIPEPEPIPAEATVQARNEYLDHYSKRLAPINEHNEKVKKVLAEAYTILWDSISTTTKDLIYLEFPNVTQNDTRRIYNWLAATYGPASLGAHDQYSAYWRMQNVTWDESTPKEINSFPKFYTSIFMVRAKAANITDPVHLRAILLSTKRDNPMKHQVLPDHLLEAVELCKLGADKTLEQCLQILTDADARERSSIADPSKFRIKHSGVRAVRVQSSVKCDACCNEGHDVSECAAPVCIWCAMRGEPSAHTHRYINCALRLEGTSQSSQKRGRGSRADNHKASQHKQQDDDASSVGSNRSQNSNYSNYNKKPKASNYNKKQPANPPAASNSQQKGHEYNTRPKNVSFKDDYRKQKNHRITNVLRAKEEDDDLTSDEDETELEQFKSLLQTLIKARLDSGSDVHIVQNADVLVEIDHQRKRKPQLEAANGTSIEVECTGRIDNILDNVAVCPDVEEPLIAVTPLLKKGYSIYIASKDENIVEDDQSIAGAIFKAETGKVAGLIDRDLNINLSQWGKCDLQVQITPPQITCYATETSQMIRRVKGYDTKTPIGQLVYLLHCVNHDTLSDMLFTCRYSLNYPVTKEDINNYYPYHCPVCIKGKFQRDSIRNPAGDKLAVTMFEDEAQSAEITSLKLHDLIKNNAKPSRQQKMLEPRNIMVGTQIGFDTKGPILNQLVLTATDKASGFTMSGILQKNGSNQGVNAAGFIREVCDTYQKFGHHCAQVWSEPISEARVDHDPILLSNQAKAVFKENKIEVVSSPPYQHQLNGLAESTNKDVSNRVTCSFVQCPHVPEQLWPHIWKLHALYRNFRPSKVPGSTKTRYEEFYGEKPDLSRIPYMPPGTVVEYDVGEKKPDGGFKFPQKTYTGVFIGLSDTIPGGIKIFSYVTKRIIERTSYRVITHVPDAWTHLTPQYFKFDGSPEEQAALMQMHEAESAYPPIYQELTYGSTMNQSLQQEFKDEFGSDQLVFQNTTSNRKNVGNASAVQSTVVQQPVAAAPTTIHIAQQSVPTATSTAAVPTPIAASTPAASSQSAPPAAQPVNRPQDNSSVASTITNGSKSGQRGKKGKKSVAAKTKKDKTTAVAPVLCTKIAGQRRSPSNKKKLYADIDETIPDLPRRIFKVSQLKNTTDKKKSKKKKKVRRDEDSPTLEQAKRRPDWDRFKEAIDAEIQQLHDEGCFEYTSYDEIKHIDTKVLNSMIILTIKRNPDGTVDKYKARLVILGNQQDNDQYDLIKSPTARSSMVKLAIALQAKTNSYSAVFDVKGAYLKASIGDKHDLYVRLPGGELVKLKKYVYGLKQAGYEWNQLLCRTLLSAGYKQSQHDKCLFYRKKKNNLIFMVTHVDDFYVVSSSKEQIEELYGVLKEAFGEVARKEGDVLAYLGMHIERNNEVISVSQPGYIKKILKKANIAEHEVSDTPYIEKLNPQEGDEEPVDKTTYLEHVGMLNYLATLTRPDLLYALSRCAQRCSNPTQEDMRRVKKIFKYVNKTKSITLTFKRGNTKDILLRGWVDASHIHHAEDSKAQYGYAFALDDNDSVFYARSTKMRIVTPAGSTESEYVALYEAATEVVYLRNILNELGFLQSQPTVIYEDNKSTMAIAAGGGDHQHIKHIQVKYHYTRDLIRDNVIQVVHCVTEDMIADMLTKPLTKAKLKRLRDLMYSPIPPSSA